MDSLVQRMQAFDSCVVSDALEALGRFGTVSGIGPVWPCGRIVGRAVTVQLRRLEPGETAQPGPHLGARAIESGEPGDIIVVAHDGRTDSAGWGGLLSAGGVAAGLSGVIIDGACRDVDDSATFGFPVFARSVTPVTARGRTVEASTGTPVQIGGITVCPGDMVIADGTGVVVVPQDLLEEVVTRAEQLCEREELLLAALRKGVGATRVMDSSYDAMLENTQEEESETAAPQGVVPGSASASTE